MGKKKKRPGGRRREISIQGAELAIRKIARRDSTTPEMVRKHIQVAMLNSLLSDDPQIKAFWARVPKAGKIPTPEELIAFVAQKTSDG